MKRIAAAVLAFLCAQAVCAQSVRYRVEVSSSGGLFYRYSRD